MRTDVRAMSPRAIAFVMGLLAVVLAMPPTARAAGGGRAPGAGLLMQRRGMVYRPRKPPTVESKPMIDVLNRALTALGTTDLSYEGHREKAINHIGSAIRFLETPQEKGQGTAAMDRALAGKGTPPVKKGSSTPADPDASIRKAKALLFNAHHQLSVHGSTTGRLRADAEVRIAIQELTLALKNTPPPLDKSTANDAEKK